MCFAFSMIIGPLSFRHHMHKNAISKDGDNNTCHVTDEEFLE